MREGASNPGIIQCLLLGLVLFQLVTYCEGTGYLGCFKEDRRNRFFCMNPAGYDPEDLVPTDCQKNCALWGWNYAGLTGGKYCFCSTVEPDAYEADATDCIDPCTGGGGADMCGGSSYVSVYKSPVQTQGFMMKQSPAGTITAGTTATFEVWYQIASDSMKYSFDYGSGRSDWNASGMFTKTFAMPGKHKVNACAQDESELVPEVCYAVEVTVVAPAQGLSMVCPEVEATEETVICNASILAGTGMTGSLDFGEPGGTLDTFDLPDTRWLSSGNDVAEHVPADAGAAGTVSKLYVLPHSPFTHEGRVVAFEFNAAVAGSLDLYILGPDCGDYCYDSNTCDPSCTDGVATCGADAYCGFSGECVDTADLSVCSAGSTFATPHAGSYVVKWKKTVTATLGYNYLAIDPEAEPMEVARGDVVGYFAAAGTLSSRTEAGDDDLEHQGVSATSAIGASIVNTFTATGTSIFLKAIAAKTLEIAVEWIYLQPNIYDVTLVVDSGDVPGPLTNTTSVIVQYGINYAIIEADEYACTNDSYFYGLANHTGSNVTYFWTWGDTQEENTTVRGLNHTYTIRGRYNITIRAENDLSSKDNESYVIVEDCIEDFTILVEHAPVHIPHPFELVMSSGSDYECIWDYGDGERNTTDVTTTPAGTIVYHTYSYEDLALPVNITCWNHVSRGEFLKNQIALYPVDNIRLEKEGAMVGKDFEVAFRVDSGTDATYTLWFDGEVIPVTYEHDILRGHTPKFRGMSLGNHNVTINGYNWVSNVTEDFMFSIESPVIGSQSKAYENYGEEEPFLEILVGQEVTFNMSLIAGTSVKVTWDFKDGSPKEEYAMGQGEAWPANGHESRTHNFTVPGCYFVEVIIANSFDTFTYTHRVCVYNSVDCLELESNSPVAYENLKGPTELHFTTTCHPPTLATVTFDFGDQSPRSDMEICLIYPGATYHHDYMEIGTYEVTAYVENPISQATYTTSVLVVEPVCNLRIHVTPEHSALGDTVEVCVSMEKGGQVSLSWDFTADGTPTTYTSARAGTTAYDKECYSTVFGTIGTKTLSVTATNPLGDTTVTYDHVVQNPVLDDCDVTSTAPKPFIPALGSATVDFTAKWLSTGPLPTDAEVFWRFGDGTESSPVPFPPALTEPAGYSMSHTYTAHGHYTAKLVVRNLANEREFDVPAGCYIMIDGLTTTPLQARADSLDPSPKPGQGADENRFSLDYDVLFDMKWTQGTVVKYMIEAVHRDGLAVQICNSSENPVPNMFTVSGEWEVNITAWNPISSDNVQTTIYVGATMKGMTVSDGNIQVGKNAPYTIDISFEKTAPDMCVLVDFADTVTGAVDTFLYSNASSCPQYPGMTINGRVTNPMTATYTYPKNGQYTVNITAGNFLHTESLTITPTISDAKCKKPVLSIYDQRPHNYDPMPMQRQDDLVLEGAAIFDCEVTVQNKKQWKLVHLSKTTGEVLEAVDLSVPEVSGTASAVLLIPARFLDYGLYRFSFTVTMDPSKFPARDIFSSTIDTHVELGAAALRPALDEGRSEMMSRGYGQNLLLQPGLFSKDPDVAEGEPQNFDSVLLFCRHVDEVYPLDSEGNYDTSNPQTPYTEAQVGVISTDDGGCFRQGPGRVKLVNEQISFNTMNMHENETYVFDLIITKGSRTAQATLKLDVLQGNPAAVEISCIQPGQCRYTDKGIRINPDRLGLEVHCKEYCEGNPIDYRWSAFQRGIGDSWIEIQRFGEHVTADYGINSTSIAISKSLFDWGFSVNSDLTTYRIRVAGLRRGESRAGVAYTVIEVNLPPWGGNCTVDKRTGVPSDTKFSFSCDGWTDDRKIVEYQFFARDSDYHTDNSLGTSRTGGLLRLMPQGSARHAYKHHIIARIIDDEGALTEVDMGMIEVQPLPLTDARSLVEELLTDPNNMLSKAVAEADLATSTQSFVEVASVLNQLSAQPGALAGATSKPGNGDSSYPTYDASRVRVYLATPYGPASGYDDNLWDNGADGTKTEEELREEYQERRSEYGQLRTEMMNALVDLTITDMSDLSQVVSTAAVVSAEVDQFNRESQILCNDLVNTAASMMHSHQADTAQDELIRITNNLLTLIGNCMESATLSIYDSSLEDIEETKGTKFYYYDTDYNSEDPWLLDMSTWGKQQDSLQKTSNVNHQKHTNKQVITGLSESAGMIGEVLLDNMVPGEDPIDILSPRYSMSLRKTMASNIMNQTIQQGNGEIKLPLFCDMFPERTDCNNDEQIGMMSMTAPVNIYSHIDNGDNVPVLTEIMDLTFYDVQGNKINVTNSDPPIELHIPNDVRMEIAAHENVSAVIPDTEDHHLFYHSFTVDKDCAALQIELIPGSSDVQLLALVRKGLFPEVNTSSMNYGMDYVLMSPSSMDPARQAAVVGGNKHMMYISQEELGCYQGKVIIGIRQLTEDEHDHYSMQSKPRTPEPNTGKIDAPYKLRVTQLGCYYLTEDNTWDTKGLWVDTRLSTAERTVCYTRHLTSFSGSFAVAPNAIDWDFVFSNADFFSNPTLYTTEIIIAVVYILVAIWARHYDRKMAFKLGSAPLPDNSPNDKYLYEILVKTGGKKSAGTDSQVSFIISGEMDETDVRIFADKKRKIFRRGATDSFLMACPRPLGPMQYMRLWHDNSGKGKYQGWFCNYIMVSDLQTKEKFVFLINKWFAVEEDDGQVDRVVPIAGPEQMVEFKNLFAHTTRKNMSDEHLWFSVVARPPQSRFTCLQRVSCCLVLLFTSMLGNAMFYERLPEDDSNNLFEFGPFALSPQQLYVGFIVNLIVFPINFLLVFLFRRSRPRSKRPSRLKAALQAHAKASGGSIQMSSTNDMRCLIEDRDDSPAPSTSCQSPPPQQFAAPKRPDTGLAVQTMAIPMQPPGHTNSYHDKKEAKKKQFTLPWWFRLIAWMLLWAVVLVSAAFVTFYGIMFQDTKCKKWISSLFISFITSIFLTQPIKVFVTALFFSLIFKKADLSEGDEEDEEEIFLKPDEEWMHSMPNDPGYSYMHRERKVHFKPPDPDALMRARSTRMKELKMFEILREILFYTFFLWILLVISYGFRDPNAYFMKQNMDHLFLDKGLSEKSEYTNNFMDIYRFEDFWGWLENTAIPNLRADIWYNGQPPIGQRGFVGDRVGRIMGYATLRQLRVRPNKCDVHEKFHSTVHECNIPYDMADETDENYNAGWSPLPDGMTRNDSAPEYIYRTADELQGYPYWGSQALYSGGGYVVNMTGGRNVLLEKVAQLKKDMWLDRYTRAIFLEFTVYNPFVNLFGIVTLCTEVVVSGGMDKYKRIEPMNLLGYYQEGFGFQIFCEILYVIFIVIFIIKETRNMYKQGKGYFKLFWNWCELMIIVLSISAVVIYFYRYIIAKDLVEEFRVSHGNKYMKFQYVGYWNEMLVYLAGWLVFLASIKFIKLLRFNKRMGMLAATLRIGAKPLGLFSIMFFVMFAAFAQFFFLIYYTELKNFRTFIHSMQTCQQMLVGKFNFNVMQGTSPVLGPLVFFCYVVTVYYILINMFLTILNEAFATVRADISLQSDEYEMVSFILKRFKQWSGIQSMLGNKKSKSKHEEFNEFATYEQQVQEFPQRMDRLVNIISRAYYMADTLDAIFDPSRPQEGKSAMKTMMKHVEEQQVNKKKRGAPMPGAMPGPSSSSQYQAHGIDEHLL